MSPSKRPRSEPQVWQVYSIGAKAKLLGSVEAKDEAEARAKAIAELKVAPALIQDLGSETVRLKWHPIG